LKDENALKMRGTTVVAVHCDGRVAIAGDGQVSIGDQIIKHGAQKVRRMSGGKVIAGFAGSVADALTLFDRFEMKLEAYKSNLPRAAMEFAREWRTDKYLRRLEAMLLVSDKEHLLFLSGNGEVIEPDDKVAAIGSGGPMALAAARALLKNTNLSAEEIARQAIDIAADICIHTNHNITVEVLE
jgi:ATP-dependent HslUV protease, peptidase subunit HslV